MLDTPKRPVGRPRIGVTQRMITFRKDDLEFLMSIDPSPTKAIRKLIESNRTTAPRRAGRPAAKHAAKEQTKC